VGMPNLCIVGMPNLCHYLTVLCLKLLQRNTAFMGHEHDHMVRIKVTWPLSF
jgi:hypothetical protein